MKFFNQDNKVINRYGDLSTTLHYAQDDNCAKMTTTLKMTTMNEVVNVDVLMSTRCCVAKMIGIFIIELNTLENYKARF